MKSSVVTKLFIWTTALCVLILAVIYVGQTVFFKQFYINQKVADVQASLQAFEQEYAQKRNDLEAVRQLEQQFYRQHNTWVTTLDQLGNIRDAADFSVEVRLFPEKGNPFANRTLVLPLYGLLNAEDLYQRSRFLRPGEMVAIDVFQSGEELVPYRLEVEYDKVWFENKYFVKKEHEIISKNPNPAEKSEEFPNRLLYGTITQAHLPDQGETPRFLYSNPAFVDRIKQFQADLLVNPEKAKPAGPLTYQVAENAISYQLFVQPVHYANEQPIYLFAMTSLQPVDEAISMIEDYYVYLILFVLLLILLSSFYYSKQIARPLLAINQTTKKMASLDFSEKIPVVSHDEIGDLSRSINQLSERLHAYIEQLQQDIEKEKQLEHTRKEFIAGVSHELKTPLSVIQSCLSIVKDGVASHKKDYYFEAMEKEVNRMDLLIIDMLELAKYESGTYKMQREPFALHEVIEQVCDKLRPDIEGKQLHLHKQLVPVVAVANQLRIEQVVVNFLTNAIRYTPEGEVVVVSIRDEGRMARVSIENKGSRIPKEQLEKIWDRFYRGEPSRQRSTGGTGLGLAICKKILELHDVPFGVCNTEEGVEFFFLLPKNE